MENDGDGNFKNVSDNLAKDLKEIGMITDADFFDYDSDGDLDLISSWSLDANYIARK